MSIYDTMVLTIINDIPYSIGIDAGEGMEVSAVNRINPSADSFVGYRIDGGFNVPYSSCAFVWHFGLVH